jgi:hypothetical protein
MVEALFLRPDNVRNDDESCDCKPHADVRAIDVAEYAQRLYSRLGGRAQLAYGCNVAPCVQMNAGGRCLKL